MLNSTSIRFEILGCKRIGAINLTFRGHVTPSARDHAFDSPQAIFIGGLWNQGSISSRVRDIQFRT